MSANDSRRRGDAAFIAALAGGAAVVDAAKLACISEATAHRRLRDPAFRREVDAARSEIVSRAVSTLSAAAVEAAETLRKLLTSDFDFCRLAAARSILELGAKLREHEELTERVRLLEERLTEQEERPWRPRTA